MEAAEKFKQRYVYFIVLALLLLVLLVIASYLNGMIDVEEGKMYLQSLTAVATLALLYYAYFNTAYKREEDIARLELAVRPILAWELQSRGRQAIFTYEAIRNPIYDFRATLKLGSKELHFEDRHLDASGMQGGQKRQHDISQFLKNALGRQSMGKMGLLFTYHSEAGGKYELVFTKEVLFGKNGFAFQHRKFVSAKYPWRQAPVIFD